MREIIIPYRYATAAIVGPWRESEYLAEQDAVRAGLATLQRRHIVWRVAGRIERQVDGPQPTGGSESFG